MNTIARGRQPGRRPAADPRHRERRRREREQPRRTRSARPRSPACPARAAPPCCGRSRTRTATGSAARRSCVSTQIDRHQREQREADQRDRPPPRRQLAARDQIVEEAADHDRDARDGRQHVVVELRHRQRHHRVRRHEPDRAQPDDLLLARSPPDRAWAPRRRGAGAAPPSRAPPAPARSTAAGRSRARARSTRTSRDRRGGRSPCAASGCRRTARSRTRRRGGSASRGARAPPPARTRPATRRCRRRSCARRSRRQFQVNAR